MPLPSPARSLSLSPSLYLSVPRIPLHFPPNLTAPTTSVASSGDTPSRACHTMYCTKQPLLQPGAEWHGATDRQDRLTGKSWRRCGGYVIGVFGARCSDGTSSRSTLRGHSCHPDHSDHSDHSTGTNETLRWCSSSSSPRPSHLHPRTPKNGDPRNPYCIECMYQSTVVEYLDSQVVIATVGKPRRQCRYFVKLLSVRSTKYARPFSGFAWRAWPIPNVPLLSPEMGTAAPCGAGGTCSHTRHFLAVIWIIVAGVGRLVSRPICWL